MSGAGTNCGVRELMRAVSPEHRIFPYLLRFSGNDSRRADDRPVCGHRRVFPSDRGRLSTSWP